MLGKLFKYDMKALSRTLVPLHVAVLVLGLVSCVAGFAGHTVGESGPRLRSATCSWRS